MSSGRPYLVLLLVCTGLIITNAVIWTVLGLDLSHWVNSRIDPGWIIANRSTVAIAVQVISQILGMVVVTVLCE